MVIDLPKFDRQRIKALRELKGLSHERFGRAIGKNKRTIINWEKGYSHPDIDDLENIAKVFQINPTSFWVSPEKGKA